MGIEPTRPAWKAGVLPLNYTRSYGSGKGMTKIPASALAPDCVAIISQTRPFVKHNFFSSVALCTVIMKNR